MIVEMYGPRAKLLVNETGREFVLILDEFDVATGKSKVVKIGMSVGQLKEWADIFQRAVAP